MSDMLPPGGGDASDEDLPGEGDKLDVIMDTLQNFAARLDIIEGQQRAHELARDDCLTMRGDEEVNTPGGPKVRQLGDDATGPKLPQPKGKPDFARADASTPRMNIQRANREHREKLEQAQKFH